MGRMLSNARLLDKLLTGEYLPILNLVKNDRDLSIEIRIKNQPKVYYKKSLLLTLFPNREPQLLAVGYWKENLQPVLDLNFPGLYFDTAKKLVEKHIDVKKNIEFTIQQKITKDNNSLRNQFLVIDMEYQFAQEKVKNRTNGKTRFDLVALDLKLNKIMLLELKQGLGSLSGNAGVDDHFLRYQEHIIHPQFQSALREDIKGIISSKNQLGLWAFNASSLVLQVDQAEIDYAYVFAAHSSAELILYKQQYGEKYTTLYLEVQANDYILKDGL
jgi:hypothetical protein